MYTISPRSDNQEQKADVIIEGNKLPPGPPVVGGGTSYLLSSLKSLQPDSESSSKRFQSSGPFSWL